MKAGRPLGFEETAWGPLAVDWAISLVGLATFKIMSNLSVDDEEKKAADLLRSFYASKLLGDEIEEQEPGVEQHALARGFLHKTSPAISSEALKHEAKRIEVLADFVKLVGKLADGPTLTENEARNLTGHLRTVQSFRDGASKSEKLDSLTQG